ncbi:MAG: ABC transporter ATP-binding protein [Firmicutes bacterium]|nr:ABC transporter ATP-binding protein [Bacillota bacterium]
MKGSNAKGGAGIPSRSVAGTVVRFRDVKKEYRTGEVVVHALRGVSFEVVEGELLVILGPSGSGKSTLLNLLGGLDRPTSGSIVFKNADLTKFNEAELTRYRRSSVGFIFQSYNLLPDLTARENVDLARELADHPLPTEEVLRKVGLEERADHFPSQLSGGEQQRVAIARAVAKNPELLLCDEPTGALDHETGKQVLKLLREVNREFGRTVLLITHNSPVAAMGDRVLRLRSGQVASVYRNENPVDPERIEW